MKRNNNIWTIAFALVMLCSCSQETIIDDDNIIVPVAPEGYIFFDAAMNANSRGTVIQDRLEQNFSVLGYRYAATWNAAYVMAKQTKEISFKNNDGDQVTEYMGVFHPNGNDKVPTQQAVTYNGATHTYSNPQPWENSLKYAFFAWYPDVLVANSEENSAGKVIDEGCPYITYNLPEGTDSKARKSMYDVLTAEKIDHDRRIHGQYVALEMKHRLAGLDIKAGHVINAKSLSETFEEWKGIADNEEVLLDVTKLGLTLNNIKTKAIIELNPGKAGKSMTTSGNASKTYTGFAGTNAIKYNDNISLVGDDEKLILIPQNEEITASIDLDYTIRCKNASGVEISKTFSGVKAEGIKIEKLEENNYYYLKLSFTKAGLFVTTLVSNQWEEKTIEHEFN